jgi:tRNA (guanine-N7-)-methyltransferase
MFTSRVEDEFGVPFPGEILPRKQWTQTGLKRLPTGIIDWVALFGRQAPVVLDLGCGNGRYAIGSALRRADHDHLGLDALPVVIRYATRRANQRGLANIRLAVGDAAEFMAMHVAPASVAEVHLYHPQPYRDPEKRERRLLRPHFLADVWCSLSESGSLFVQTDNPAYWRYLEEVLPALFELRPMRSRWPDAPQGRTRREIIALRRGLSVCRAICRPRRELDEAEARSIAGQLPQPVFDARDEAMSEEEIG